MMAPRSALCERSDFKLVHLNSRSHNGEIVQLQSALNDDYNNFQEKSNTNHISEPIIGRYFPDLVLVRSLRSSFTDSFSSAKKRCNTFGAFFGQSCDRDRFLFPFISEFLSFFSLFLDFIAISDCVFNNKNNCVLGHTGYQIIITILVISSTPSLYVNLRVATRVYDVEGGAIFF